MTTPQPFTISKGPVPNALAQTLHETLQATWASLDRVANGYGSLIVHANPDIAMVIEHAQQVARHAVEVLEMVDVERYRVVSLAQENRR